MINSKRIKIGKIPNHPRAFKLNSFNPNLLPNTNDQMFNIWNKRFHLPLQEIIMGKSFMVKLGRQNVFFFYRFTLLIVWGTIALNILLHQKAPYYFNLYSFKSYLFKRISLCYSYTPFIQQNKSCSMKGV